MLSHRLTSLATTLQTRPDLVQSVATLLHDLADCVRALEQIEVPQHLRQPVPIPAGVTRLDDVRRARA